MELPADQQPLRIAYLHYGAQSGVTSHVLDGLRARGHEVIPLEVVGPLEPRDPHTRSFQFTWPVVAGLAASALRHGIRAKQLRWNTPFAFDFHSRRGAELVAGLSRPPDVVLQNGALFAPGVPVAVGGTGSPVPYALLLDHTRALSMQHPPMPEAGLAAPRDYGPDWRRRETETYRNALLVASFSDRVRQSLHADYGVSSDRTLVVGGGANVWPVRPERKDDGRTFLFVGKDFQRKGGPVLLRAFQQVRRRVPDARLLIAGPTAPLDLPAGAEQLGLVPMADLPALFARASIFVLPTLKEPFGLAYLDAMACGLPCIGTRIEAVPEIVEDGQTGLLVPPADPRGLADAMVALVNDPERCRRMGELGRLKVDLGGRWHHAVERLETGLYERLRPAATEQRPAAIEQRPAASPPARSNG